MGHSYFFDEKLRRSLEKDIEKRAKLEKSELRDMSEFYRQVREEKLNTLSSLIESKGHQHEIEKIAAIRDRINSCTATPNDAMELLNLYESYKDSVDEI